MTEIIALTVFLIALGKKSQSLDGNTPIGRLVSIATGGIIEELVEEGVEGILKLPELIFESISGMSDYFRKRKIIGAAVVSLARAVENMSDKERETLSDFLCEAYEGSLNDKEYKKFRKTYLKAQSELGKHRNDRKRLIKGFYKVVDSVVDSFTEKMLEDFSYKDGEALAESYLGRRDIPAPVAETARIVCECMYELKYVSMADEDRDVIKLTQEIVSRNNEKMAEVLMNRLKGYFNLVANQNSRVRPIAKKTLSQAVKSDLSLWVELSCPSCGAVGNLVSKEGELLKCHLCNRAFELYDSTGDEVLSVLDEMSAAMEQGLSGIKRDGESIKTELSRLSLEMLKSNKRLLDSVIFHSDDLKQRSRAITEAAEAACKSIERLVREESRDLKEVLNSVSELILSEMTVRFDRTDKKLDDVRAIIDDIYIKTITDGVKKSHGEVGGEKAPEPVEQPKIRLCTCRVCGARDDAWSEEGHQTCGALKDGSNVYTLTLFGANIESLSLSAKGGCDGELAEVVRVELGSLPHDVSNEYAYTVDFSRRDETERARGVLGSCRTAVLYSSYEIKLSLAFVQRFAMLLGPECDRIAFGRLVKIPKVTGFNGWHLGNNKRTLVRG